VWAAQRDIIKVWTALPVDPGDQTQCTERRMQWWDVIEDALPKYFAQRPRHALVRVRRRISDRCEQWQWRCVNSLPAGQEVWEWTEVDYPESDEGGEEERHGGTKARRHEADRQRAATVRERSAESDGATERQSDEAEKTNPQISQMTQISEFNTENTELPDSSSFAPSPLCESPLPSESAKSAGVFASVLNPEPASSSVNQSTNQPVNRSWSARLAALDPVNDTPAECIEYAYKMYWPWPPNHERYPVPTTRGFLCRACVDVKYEQKRKPRRRKEKKRGSADADR